MASGVLAIHEFDNIKEIITSIFSGNKLENKNDSMVQIHMNIKVPEMMKTVSKRSMSGNIGKAILYGVTLLVCQCLQTLIVQLNLFHCFINFFCSSL